MYQGIPVISIDYVARHGNIEMYTTRKHMANA